LIVPIEIISYISRIFSLAIRLFANMMSGHTLLFILVSFLYGALTVNLLLVLPTAIISLIFLLDVGVAFLQIYVFVILLYLYMLDVEYYLH